MYQPNDYVNQLAEYFIKNLKKGYTLDDLRYALMNQGYSRITVEHAIEQAHKKMIEQAPLMKEKPKITYTVLDENNMSIEPKRKSWFRRFFGF